MDHFPASLFGGENVFVRKLNRIADQICKFLPKRRFFPFYLNILIHEISRVCDITCGEK